MGLLSFGAPALVSSTPVAASVTSSCVDVGTGATVPSSGPNRATVVVDTGDGPVWSACISFSGTITGAKALELARATIPDLDPGYEIYSGEGVAVCWLRGVGADPPNCLTADKAGRYWRYIRNGRYAAGGAGASEVEDGDVETWSWGTTGPWRSATVGTRAVAGVPVTTTTTTTAPVGSGGGTATSTVPAHVGATGSSDTTSTVPGATTTQAGPDGSATTTAVAGTSGALGATLDAPGGSGGGDDESASAASASGAPIAAGGAVDGSSGTTTVFGVLGALAVIGGLGALARRRRRPVGT